MGSVNYTFFLSLCIILIGFISKKLGILSENDGKTLSRVIFNITLPAVILVTVPSVELNVALAIMPILCIVFSILVGGFALWYFRHYKGEQRGILLMTCLGFNVGNFAYPLVEGIWGTVGLQYVAMFDVGNALIMFIVVYILGVINSQKMAAAGAKVDPKVIGKKIIRSPPLLCYFIGIIMSAAGWEMPVFLFDVLSIIARANMAIVLLTLGLFLNFKFEPAEWGDMFKVIAIRYSFGLLVGWLLYAYLPFEHFIRVIILVCFIIPIGMAVLTFSVELEYTDKNQQVIGTLTNLTLVISFFLMWILIAVLGTG